MTSPGARYSAGTAFLDVIPSFRGVQKAMQRELRGIEQALGKEAGEEFGKSFEQGATKGVDRALGTTKAQQEGKEAGARYAGAFAAELQKAMKGVEREVAATLKFGTDDAAVKRSLEDIQKRVQALTKAKIGVDLDAGRALAAAAQIKASIEAVQQAARGIDLKVNAGAMNATLERARKQIESLNGIKITPEIDDRKIGLFEQAVRKRLEAAVKNLPAAEFDADISKAEGKIQELRDRMLQLADKRIGIDIDGSSALAEMEGIRRELATLAEDAKIDVQVRTDAAGAATELVGIRTLAEVVDNTKVEIKVDVDTGQAVTMLGRLHNSLMDVAGGGEAGANGFRAFNPMVLAMVTMLPAAVPLLGALAGGLALVGPLALGAASGVGVLGFAFMGIQDAVSAMGKAQESAGKESETSARRIASAARSVEDAQRAVERAETSGARNIAQARRAVDDARANAAQVAEDSTQRVNDAIRSQERAEQSLEQAQEGVVRAQEAVNAAREQAQQRIEDLALAIRGGALAEEEARLRLAKAEREYREAVANPAVSAEDREQLRIDLEQQRLQVERLTLENGRLGDEQAEANRTGVEGSREVLSAQEQLQAAEARRADAQRAVSDAVRAVGEAVRDGQRAQAEATIAIQDAIANERLAREDAAAAISNAQANLKQAQDQYTEAINQTSASADALRVAMDNLSPAGQRFATFIFDVLMPRLRELRDIAQAGIFPGLEDAITRILTVNGPMLNVFMTNMSGVLGQLFRDFGDMMTSPQWMGIWATFTQYAPIFMQQFGEVGMAMLTFFGELFQGLAPYSERFGAALVVLAEKSAAWMAAFTDSPLFREIMEWLFTHGPKIAEDMWSILQGAGALIVALWPLGEAVLGVLGNIGKLLASMDPALLGVIVTGILGLVVAFQLAAGASALFATAATIAVTPLAMVIFIVGLVVVALVALYTQSETARNIIDAVFRAIGAVIVWWWETVVFPVFGFVVAWWQAMVDGIVWAWENVLKPAWDALVAVVQWLWNEILMPIFGFIGDAWAALATAFMWWYENMFKPVFDFFMAMAQIFFAFLTVVIFAPLILAWELLGAAFKWVYDNIIKPYVIDQFMRDMTWLWENILRPIWDAIQWAWDKLSAGMKWVYDNIIKPYIIDQFKGDMEALGEFFGTVVDTIGRLWEGLKNALSKPINFVIKYVLNEGLFDAFNWVIDKLGLDAGWKMKHWNQVGDPSTHYATGGRVAGWSPNPTADNIPAMLTAGEYVHPVHAVNYYGSDVMEAIRKKRIPREALAESLRHYASGGFVLPKTGGRAVYTRPSNMYGMGPEVVMPQYAASGGQIALALAKVFPRLKINSTYRPGDSGFHGRNQAVDLGEQGFPGGSGRQYIADMKEWVYRNWHNANEIIYNGRGNKVPNVKNGRDFPYSLATQQQHYNHLHLAIAGSILSALGGPGGGPIGSGSVGIEQSLLGGIWDSVEGVFNHIKGGLAKLTDFTKDFGDNTFTQAIGGTVKKLPDMMWGKIKGQVQQMWDDLMAANADNPAGNEILPSFSGPVQDIVKAVAAKRGWGTGSEWNALSRLIAKESSWNPNAQNKTSTAYGLFQFLNSTWAGTGIAKTSDPSRQAEAGLRYIAGRYGSPSKALAFHLKNNWYSEGGEVTENGPAHLQGSAPAEAPTLYDTGGWLPPGVTTVLNATNRPEPVLTGQAWEELVSSRDSDYDGGRRGIEQLHIHEVATDMSEAIDTVNHWVRVYERGGRY